MVVVVFVSTSIVRVLTPLRAWRNYMRCARFSPAGEQQNSLYAREEGLCAVPDLCAVNLVADNILEMRRKGLAIDLGGAAGPADSLGDVEDDTREATLVDVDLLVVGDLPDRAGERGRCAETKVSASEPGKVGEGSLTPSPENTGSDGHI